MKKHIINIILALVAIAALVWSAPAKGMQWFIPAIIFVVAVEELLRRNTDTSRTTSPLFYSLPGSGFFIS